MFIEVALFSETSPALKNLALLHFRTPLGRFRVRATVKLSAAFFHDESSITIGGYETAIVPKIPGCMP